MNRLLRGWIRRINSEIGYLLKDMLTRCSWHWDGSKLSWQSTRKDGHNSSHEMDDHPRWLGRSRNGWYKLTLSMTQIRVPASRHHSKQKQAAMKTPSFRHQTSAAASGRLLALCLWSLLLVLEVCLWVSISELSVCIVSRSPMMLLSLCTSRPKLAKTTTSLKMIISNAVLVKTVAFWVTPLSFWAQKTTLSTLQKPDDVFERRSEK